MWKGRGSGLRLVREVLVQHLLTRRFVGVMARQEMFDVADHPRTVVTALQLHVSSIQRLGFSSHSSLVSGNNRQDSLPIPFHILPPMEHSSSVSLVGRCGWLKHLRCSWRWSMIWARNTRKTSHDRNSQWCDNLHNPQTVLRPSLLLARETQLQARSAASSLSLSQS